MYDLCAAGGGGGIELAYNAKSPGHPHWVYTSLARVARWPHTSYRLLRSMDFGGDFGLPSQPMSRRRWGATEAAPAPPELCHAIAPRHPHRVVILV